jgi:hypothetical protein
MAHRETATIRLIMSPCWKAVVAALLWLALPAVSRAQPKEAEPDALIRQAFGRLYNFDFRGTHEILEKQIRLYPQDPLGPAVDAVAYLFTELYRLRILELDFFTSDEKFVDRRKLVPDPAARQAFQQQIDNAERLAQARLAVNPDDRSAVFSMCVTTGLTVDYAVLIEKRRFGSYSLAKRNQFWARKSLALNPPVYDAYVTIGTAEYIVGSLPFFLRWFVRFDQIKGNKQTASEVLEVVVQKGKYYGPLARILMAVIDLRERRRAEGEKLLVGLVADFPENPLLRKELAKVGGRGPGAGGQGQ